MSYFLVSNSAFVVFQTQQHWCLKTINKNINMRKRSSIVKLRTTYGRTRKVIFLDGKALKKTMYLWIGWKNNNNQGYTYIYIILLRIVSIFDFHLLIFTYLVFWRILYLTKTESLPTAGFNFGFNLLIFTFGSIPLTDLFPHFLTFTPLAD